MIEHELESYTDANVGTIVFNRTNLPRNRCQEFRSVAKIEDGQLFHSKTDKFSIYRYERDEEQVAITLNQNMKTCGRVLYRTGIPKIHVMLIEKNEKFLENEKLRLVEFEEGVIFEAELSSESAKSNVNKLSLPRRCYVKTWRY